MLLLIGLILVVGGFGLGYITHACFVVSVPYQAEGDEGKPFLPPAIPRADCMPPGCNDYPECSHRY